MRVYEIKGDWELAWIDCSDPEDAGLLDRVTRGLAVIDRSRKIELEVSDWDAPGDWVETDCPRRPAYGTVLLSEQAISVLGFLLVDSGYLIDTKLAFDKSYKLFICEREIDALDLERSDIRRFRSGNISDMLRYELHADRLRDQHVFRLKYRPSRVFVSDRVVDLVREHGLTGFVFEEIWSSETGGVQLPPAVLPIERVPGEFARRAAAKRRALRQELARRAGGTPGQTP